MRNMLFPLVVARKLRVSVRNITCDVELHPPAIRITLLYGSEFRMLGL